MHIMRLLPVLAIICGAGTAAQAQGMPGLAFLIGRWTGGAGQVADTGQRSTGSSIITPELGGAVLLRRDHTELFDTAGKPAGSFDQLMTIYAEGGAIHADYFDGSHVIHYGSAVVEAGRSVVFTSAALPGRPVFRLSYRRAGNVLGVDFAMAPPGSAAFHAIATGTLRKAP